MHDGAHLPLHSCSRPEPQSWLISFEETGLFSARPAALAGEARDLGPALHEGVVRQRVARSLLPLADGVEPIGELAGDLGLAAELADELRGRAFPARIQHAD